MSERRLSKDAAHEVAVDFAYDRPKPAYKLDQTSPAGALAPAA